MRKKKIDLGCGYLGNGLTFWNRAKEVHGDYEKIAHISEDGKTVQYWIKNPTQEVIDFVEKYVKEK